MPLRGVGIDIVDVDRVAHLIRTRGEAFTGRWFSAKEAAQCNAADQPAVSFAARLAAKEAVWKSLGLDGNRSVPWRLITVDSSGGPEKVELHGDVAVAAGAAGVRQVSVSTSTRDDLAMAVAMAWCPADKSSPDP